MSVLGLENELRTKLHGQHLASRIVAYSIRGHLENNNPPKALSLSLHGSTGIGKTFVSEMIARNLYKKGMDSKFVKRFYGQTDFPDARFTEQYRVSDASNPDPELYCTISCLFLIRKLFISINEFYRRFGCLLTRER